MAAITICSDFGAPKIKSDIVSTVSPSISHELMGPDATKFLISVGSNSLICFLLWNILLVSCLRTLCLNQGGKLFLPKIFFKKFYSFRFYTWVYDSFWVIFVFGLRLDQSTCFCICDQFPSTICWKDHCLLSLHLCQKSPDNIYVVLFLESNLRALSDT